MDQSDPTAVAVNLPDLRETAGDTTEELQEILELYLTQTESHLVELREAFSQSNASSVEHIAHACKGASLCCGMNPLGQTMLQLETQGREGNLDGVDQLLEQSQKNFDDIKQYLREHLSADEAQGLPL